MINIFQFLAPIKCSNSNHQDISKTFTFDNNNDIVCAENEDLEKLKQITLAELNEMCLKGFDNCLKEKFYKVAQDLKPLEHPQSSYVDQSMRASCQPFLDCEIEAFFNTIKSRFAETKLCNLALVLLQQFSDEQHLKSNNAKVFQQDQLRAEIELSFTSNHILEIANRAKERHKDLNSIKSHLFESCLNFMAQDHAELANSGEKIGLIDLIDRVEPQKLKLAVYKYIQFVKPTFYLSSFNKTQLKELNSYYSLHKGGDGQNQLQSQLIESFRKLRHLMFEDIGLQCRNPQQIKLFQESLQTMLQSNHKLGNCILLFLFQTIQLTAVSDEFIEAGSNALEILINVGFDFSGLDLSNCKISNISLAGGNFTFASLASSQFENVDISGCNFSNANLSNVNWVNIKSNEQAQLSIPYCDIKRLAYTSDGKFLISGGTNGQIQIWNKKTGYLEHSMKGYQDEIRAICVSKLNDLIATGGRDCTVRLWDIGEKKLLASLGTHNDCVNAVQFFDEHTQRKLVSVAYDGKLKFWDISNLQIGSGIIKCIDGHPKPIKCIDVLQENQIMATGSSDNKIKVWDLFKLDLIKSLVGHTAQVTSIVFASQQSLLISASYDSTIRLWKLEKLNEFDKLIGHTAPVLSLAICRSGQILASGGKENTVRLWCLKSLQVVGIFAGAVGSVESLSFDPTADLLALSGEASFVQIIDSTQLLRNKNQAWHSDYISSVAFSPNGKFVASGSYDNTVKIWELSINPFVQRAKLFKILADHSDHIEAVAFSRRGQYLASGGWDKSIRIWNTNTWMCWKVLNQHSEVLCVAFSNDEKLLYSSDRGGSMRVWDLQSVKQMCKIITYSQTIKVVVPSPELANQKYSFVLSGGAEKKINFWNLQRNQNDDEKSNQIGSFDTDIQALVFSKFENKEYLICCDKKSSIWVHDMKSLPIHRSQLDGHQDGVTSLAVSPINGRYLISGSCDRTVRIWDVSKLAQLHVFLAHEDVVTSVSFSPDGYYIVSGSRDKTLRFWEFTPTQEPQKHISNQSTLYLLAHSQESHMLALTDKENAIRIFSTTTNKEVMALWKHTNLVTGICFFSEGEYLASSSMDCTIIIWKKNLDAHFSIFQTLELQSPVTSFAFQQNTLVSCCQGIQNFRIWKSAKNGSQFKQENSFGHDILVRQVRFSPDGNLIVSSGVHKKLLIRYLRENKSESYQMFADVGSLDFLKIRGQEYLALEMPSTVGIWNFKTRQIEKEIPSQQMKVIGNQLVTLKESRVLQVWEFESIYKFQCKTEKKVNFPIMTFIVENVDNSEDLYYYMAAFSGEVYICKEQPIELPRKGKSETNDEQSGKKKDLEAEKTKSFLDTYYIDTLGAESKEKRQQIEMMQIRQNNVAVNNTIFCQSKIISNLGYQLTDYYKNYTIFKK